MIWSGDEDGTEHRMMEAVAAVATGSECDLAPDNGAILVDCVVIMGWVTADGEHASSHMRCGSPWGTRGLLLAAIEEVDVIESETTRRNVFGDDG